MTAAAANKVGGGPVKCVVWDLDGTLLRGTLGSTPVPELDPRAEALVLRFDRLGLLQSIASRNAPRLAGLLSGATLDLFLVPQVSWEWKSTAVRRIARALDVSVDGIVLVDDDAFERAEVAHMLPQVRAISLPELIGLAKTPLFTPRFTTQRSARRPELYRRRLERTAAEQAFEGNRAAFLKSCDMQATVRLAVVADLPRLLELADRARRFSSSDQDVDAAQLAAWTVGSGSRRVVVIDQRDRFLDEGTIGLAVVDVRVATWAIEFLALSCRATGTGSLDILLSWLDAAARAAGCHSSAVRVRPTPDNGPLRAALRTAGYAVPDGPTDDDLSFVRPVSKAPVPPPAWVRILMSA